MGKKVNDGFKSLVVRDIAARLPYGITVRVTGEWFYDEEEPFDCDLSIQYNSELAKFENGELELKPYLRSMETMTEEEKKSIEGHQYSSIQMPGWKIDFYLSHHLDFRGLIPMGLALEAPKDMYKH